MPTLSTVPETIKESREYGGLSSSGSGLLMRRNVYPSGRKHRTFYTLGWSLATQAEADALIGVFDSAKGGTLTWTPPGGSAGSYLIAEDSLSVIHQSGGLKSIEITLEEV